jgi:hypothetical protein
MLRCKQVSDALADRRYWELPWWKRVGLRLHVGLCIVCGRYNRQVMIMQDACRKLQEHELTDPPPPGQCMPSDCRKRCDDLIQKNL